MTIVVKIGGCNGSGKTTLMREVMRQSGPLQPIPKVLPTKKVDGYTTDPASGIRRLFLGSYENVCGGMDTISDKLLVRKLVHEALDSNADHIFFEGLITGKTYGYLGELSEDPSQMGKWIYAFMDTPWEVCVERVLARRAAAGNSNPFDAERTMRPTFKSIHSTAKRVAERGHPVYWINHALQPSTAALKLLVAVKEYATSKHLPKTRAPWEQKN